MKLERKNLKKVKKILKDIPYQPTSEKFLIAIPIETEKNCNIDGLEITLKNNEYGVKRSPDPVLLLSADNDAPVVFGYADISYAKTFDIVDYCELIGSPLGRNADIIRDCDVLLVAKENVLISFKI